MYKRNGKNVHSFAEWNNKNFSKLKNLFNTMQYLPHYVGSIYKEIFVFIIDGNLPFTPYQSITSLE